MISNLFIIFFSIIYLLIINYFLRKFNFSLDKDTTNENHKSLLRLDNFTPLSGTFYFLPVIIILFYKLESAVLIICSLFFILGLFSDLKILNSYKLRLLFQILFLSLLFFINKDIEIYTRINFFDKLMGHDLSRIILCTFFFMVLINGFNLIDGANSLCTLNFLIISIFSYLIIHNLNISFINNELNIFIIPIGIFFILNFFGLNFLGDGAAYGIGFLLGYILVKISLIDNSISPYFIANLFWYPAFENLFSILRRAFTYKNNYLPDNKHLHQLIYKFFKKKNFIKKNFLLSSSVGLIINLILLINYSIGYIYLSNTIVQITLIVSCVILYLITYYSLAKKISTYKF